MIAAYQKPLCCDCCILCWVDQINKHLLLLLLLQEVTQSVMLRVSSGNSAFHRLFEYAHQAFSLAVRRRVERSRREVCDGVSFTPLSEHHGCERHDGFGRTPQCEQVVECRRCRLSGRVLVQFDDVWPFRVSIHHDKPHVVHEWAREVDVQTLPRFVWNRPRRFCG